MPERDPVRSVCGLVTYDGTDYHGFQSQVNVPTIQATLERALGSFTHLDGRVIGSGRTDTGVHASGQVVAVRVTWRHDLPALQRAWNSRLPSSIVVAKLQEAPFGFHPRFSAVTRRYRYTIVDGDQATTFARVNRSPLSDRFALFIPQQLNVDQMQMASQLLIGRHDFVAFGQPPQGKNSVRTLVEAEWHVVKSSLPLLRDETHRRLVFMIGANAFLRQMVRSIVGALLEVGCGNWSPEQFGDVLMSRDRSRCAPPAPPCGLVLERVEYPVHFQLDL